MGYSLDHFYTNLLTELLSSSLCLSETRLPALSSATRFEWVNLRPVQVSGACGLWKGKVWTQASSMGASHFVSTPPRSCNHLLHSWCHLGQDLCCVPTSSHELPYSLEAFLCNNSHQLKTRTHGGEWILLAKPLPSCCYPDKGEHTLESNLSLVCNSILFYTSSKHTHSLTLTQLTLHVQHLSFPTHPLCFSGPSCCSLGAAPPLRLLTHPVCG